MKQMGATRRHEQLSILVVDDQEELLDVFREELGERLGHRIRCAYMPAEAMRYANEVLWDIVVIDAKIMYKGAPLGGLILADEITTVLGMNTVLLVSQYDVREEVRHSNPSLAFLPKPRIGTPLRDWMIGPLLTRVRELLREQYGFVAMPFRDSSIRFYREMLVLWLAEAGFVVRNMDDIATVKPINHELLNRIRDSHFVIVYGAEENANVYLEAGIGYAHGKFVVLLWPTEREPPFNIRSNRILRIGNEDSHTKAALLEFLSRLRAGEL